MNQHIQDLPKKLTPTLKKKITKDWNEYLPGLTLRKSMSLYRRVGPLLIGIGLQAKFESEYYAPGFSVHNLSSPEDFLAAMLDEPLRTLRTEASTSIRVRWHNRLYKEAVERMSNQAWLPLDGPISLIQVITAYRKYVEKYNWPHQQIGLLEDPVLISAWAGEQEHAQEALEWGYQMLKTWNEQTLEKGQTVPEEREADKWRSRMKKLIAHPEALREITREEVIKHKLEKVPYQDFTDTSYKESDPQ